MLKSIVSSVFSGLCVVLMHVMYDTYTIDYAICHMLYILCFLYINISYVFKC